MIKSLPLFAAALLAAAPVFAQTDVVLTPTADTWLRSDNKNDNSSSTKLEIRTQADGTKDFVAVLVFAAPTVPSGYEIESATLRVTTERIKTNGFQVNIFGITGEIEENGIFATYEPEIAGARATDPIATVTLAGQYNKSVASDNITEEAYKTITAWQNNIDVTTYVKSITTKTFGFLFSAAVNANNSSNIFSKEATTAKLDGVTAADLIPQITVTFKKAAAPVDPTAIKDITSDDAATPTFNLLGQKVNSNYKGVVIRGGKKFIQK